MIEQIPIIQQLKDVNMLIVICVEYLKFESSQYSLDFTNPLFLSN